jgi:glutaminase
MQLPISEHLATVHRDLLPLRDGAPADYIPELAKVDPDRFAIAIVTVDGHVYSVGDDAVEFTIQSISKALVYGLALADRSRAEVRERVGVEPSGEAFNSISLDPRTGAPRNPMINAGAIATTALIRGADVDEQWQRILDFLSACAGRPLVVDDEVYRSESSTGYRNRAIAWMLRNFDKTAEDPMPVLENYFKQCSVQVTVRDLATMAATLASGGINPLSGTRVLPGDDVQSVLSVMSTCGMYDASGAWLHDVGLPAKSGVGGGIMAVLPGRLGIAVFSPRLDAQGNSVRGLATCRRLSADFGLHIFAGMPRPELVLARIYTAAESPSGRRRSAAQAAILRDEAEGIRILAMQGQVGIDGAEYLIRQMADLAPGSHAVILDLHRVTSLSDVASDMLLRAAQAFAGTDMELVLARIPDREGLSPQLTQAVREQRLRAFPDVESATAWCEGQVLRQANVGTERIADVSIDDFPLFTGLSPSDRELVMQHLTVRTFAPGAECMRQGTSAEDGVYLLTKGELEVHITRPDQGLHRIATLSPGQAVGELSLAGQPVRGATVIARTAAEVRCLSVADFQALLIAAPLLHTSILKRLCLEMADKFATTNRLVASLHLADAPAIGSLVQQARTTRFWRRATGQSKAVDSGLFAAITAPQERA